MRGRKGKRVVRAGVGVKLLVFAENGLEFHLTPLLPACYAMLGVRTRVYVCTYTRSIITRAYVCEYWNI